METKTKTYNAERRLSRQAREAIENTIAEHERWSSSFFWRADNGNANTRASRERWFERIHPSYRVTTTDAGIEVYPTMHQSRGRTYYTLYVYVYPPGSWATADRERKDIRVLKKMLTP